MPVKPIGLRKWTINSRMASAFLLLCVLLQPVHSHAQGLNALHAYEGTWTVRIERFNTAQSKAGSDSSTLRNECWQSGQYFVCNQFVNGESKALLVFTYDAKTDEYTSYPIVAGAGAGHGTLRIKGNEWTFPWSVSEGGTTTYFRVVNVFASGSKIEYRKEFSTDQEHWTLMEQGEETRVTAR